jgi:hypothetical protein
MTRRALTALCGIGLVLFGLAGVPATLSARVVEQKAGQENVYVAVGYGGRRMTSRDGITWENLTEWAEKGGDDSNNLMSIAYGKGKFVAVGGGGWTKETQAGHILVSEDGKTWREVQKLPFRVNPILFTGSRFVAGGPDKTLWWSEDGEKWTAGAKVDFPGWAFWFRHGAAGNGLYLFTGNADPKQKTFWCAVSKDGQTITNFKTDLPPIRDIAFGAGRFVLVGLDGVRLTSTDGVAWEETGREPEVELSRVVWTGTQFFATGQGTVFTSPDGKTWTKGDKKIPCTVLYATDTAFIGTSWPGQMWHSADGQKWTKGATLPPNGINDVAVGIVSTAKPPL